MVAHFTLYNAIGWRVVLAESGGAPATSVALASNPLDPVTWSDDVADDIDLPLEWLDAPAFGDEFARARERFGAVARKHFDRRMDQELDRYIREALGRRGVAEGDPVPREVWLDAAEEISSRFAHLICKVPYEPAYTRPRSRNS